MKVRVGDYPRHTIHAGRLAKMLGLTQRYTPSVIKVRIERRLLTQIARFARRGYWPKIFDLARQNLEPFARPDVASSKRATESRYVMMCAAIGAVAQDLRRDGCLTPKQELILTEKGWERVSPNVKRVNPKPGRRSAVLYAKALKELRSKEKP